MNLPQEQHQQQGNIDLLPHHYQQQPQQSTGTNQNDYNYQYMTM